MILSIQHSRIDDHHGRKGCNMKTATTDIDFFQTRIHHVGVIVQNIEKYLERSFWSLQSSIVYDSIQKCRLCLVSIGSEDRTPVELIEPVGKDSPVFQALNKGQTLHHICIEIPAMEEADAFIRKYRLLPVTKWQPAELFRGRLIRFAFTRNQELMEFVTNEHLKE
jgi:hypothetical protein